MRQCYTMPQRITSGYISDADALDLARLATERRRSTSAEAAAAIAAHLEKWRDELRRGPRIGAQTKKKK